MKKLSLFVFVISLIVGISFQGYSQTEVKGSGTTGATFTFITKNASNDTSLVILDNGKVGIDTTSPVNQLEVKGIIGASGGIQFGDGTLQTTAAIGGVTYAQVFTVALAGGDFPTISAALAVCAAAGAGPGNPFLIRVMPGIYVENVTCLQYVHMKGSGKYVTNIIGWVNMPSFCVIEDFYIENGIVCLGTSPTIIHNIITNKGQGYGGSPHGILINPHGKPWIKENEVVDCMMFGIYCNGFGCDAWIIANKIKRNSGGGIACIEASPLISNNLIDSNHVYGIYIAGGYGTPAEPTIDDNVIGHTDYTGGGVGIYMKDWAEPRIIANDIYLNEHGIWIDPNTQPSIIGNNINYNFQSGIWCASTGSTKRVVITSNHIHSSAHVQGGGAGIWISAADPMISFNNITQNDPAGLAADIDYSTCAAPIFPTISSNVYDIIFRSGPIPAAPGNYNTDSAGLPIQP